MHVLARCAPGAASARKTLARGGAGSAVAHGGGTISRAWLRCIFWGDVHSRARGDVRHPQGPSGQTTPAISGLRGGDAHGRATCRSRPTATAGPLPTTSKRGPQTLGRARRPRHPRSSSTQALWRPRRAPSRSCSGWRTWRRRRTTRPCSRRCGCPTRPRSTSSSTTPTISAAAPTGRAANATSTC